MKYIIIFIFLSAGCAFLPYKLAGDFEFDPVKQKELIGDVEKKMISSAFQGIDLKKMRDMHVHMVGVGHNHTGIEINDKMKSILHFKQYIRYKMFMTASGVRKNKDVDQQYLQRLKKMIIDGGLIYKHHILAFDRNYNEDGSINHDHTEMYIPNEYVFNIAKKNPEIFETVISVHPYRKDAVDRINHWGSKGVRFVKWLPNAMGIHPANDNIDEYYLALKKWDMTLLTHVGTEQSLESAHGQYLGNPLFLKKPLNLGVKIFAAHAAAAGSHKDLENPGKTLPSYKLLLRLMDRDEYKDHLKIDISATLLTDRTDRVILDLLKRKDLHSRFTYGSDYPVPGVNLSIPLKKMAKAGFISDQMIQPLRNIYKVNPLLFNFVFYRHIQHPRTSDKFSPEAFYF